LLAVFCGIGPEPQIKAFLKKKLMELPQEISSKKDENKTAQSVENE